LQTCSFSLNGKASVLQLGNIHSFIHSFIFHRSCTRYGNSQQMFMKLFNHQQTFDTIIILLDHSSIFQCAMCTCSKCCLFQALQHERRTFKTSHCTRTMYWTAQLCDWKLQTANITLKMFLQLAKQTEIWVPWYKRLQLLVVSHCIWNFHKTKCGNLLCC
jgi:hypothetical protein